MAIISDDLVTDLRSLHGTELERTVHDAIKVGIDDALTKNIAPVMVGYEAMAQGLAILTGADLDQSRDALLNVIKDLGAQLSAIQTVTPPPRMIVDFALPIGSGLSSPVRHACSFWRFGYLTSGETVAEQSAGGISRGGVRGCYGEPVHLRGRGSRPRAGEMPERGDVG